MKNLVSKIQKLKNSTFPMNKKAVFTFLICFVAITSAHAGAGAIAGWATEIGTWLAAAVGIFAVAGGFIVFVQYMQGDSSAQGNFIKLVVGIAIFALMTFIVQLFLPNVTTPDITGGGGGGA